MDLHLILAPDHAPEFATVETESKRLARERGGSAQAITLPDTKRPFVAAMNLLFAEVCPPAPVVLSSPPVSVRPACSPPASASGSPIRS